MRLREYPSLMLPYLYVAAEIVVGIEMDCAEVPHLVELKRELDVAEGE